MPGAPFIYYKGRRRADGSSASPEYYGHGVVGDVTLTLGSEDLPPARRRWSATIRNWTPFDESVAFQAEDGTYLETGTPEVAANYWRDGVRRIARAKYVEILLRGGTNPPAASPQTLLVEDSGPLQPATGSLINLVKPGGAGRADTDQASRAGKPRRSKQATVVGTAAEKLIFEMLRSRAAAQDHHKIRWVAREGLTPGYDIQDDRTSALITAYEVKGTTGSSFSAVDITANEMNCAKKLGAKYALVLVSGVGSPTPRYQVVADIAQRLEAKEAVATPSVYSLAFTAPV